MKRRSGRKEKDRKEDDVATHKSSSRRNLDHSKSDDAHGDTPERTCLDKSERVWARHSVVGKKTHTKRHKNTPEKRGNREKRGEKIERKEKWTYQDKTIWDKRERECWSEEGGLSRNAELCKCYPFWITLCCSLLCVPLLYVAFSDRHVEKIHDNGFQISTGIQVFSVCSNKYLTFLWMRKIHPL